MDGSQGVASATDGTTTAKLSGATELDWSWNHS
jgi:hypothetical protein